MLMQQIPPQIFQNILGQALSEEECKFLTTKVIYLTPQVGKLECKPGLYIILKGKIRLLDTQGKQLKKLGVWEAFGEYILFPNSSFIPYEIRVSIGVELGFIDRIELTKILKKYPKIEQRLQEKAKEFNFLIDPEPIRQKKETKKTQKVKSQKDSKTYFPFPSQKVGHWWQKVIKRYPFFTQQSASDCGAACLVMITKYWGKQVSINRLREIADVNRDGASLKGLMTAGESLGYSTRPVKASLEGLGKQNLPAIAHWEGKHFVVVWEITKKQVIIGDPAIGQLTLNRSEFVSKWTGFVLLLEPTLKLRQTEEYKTSLWQFIELVKPHWFVLLEVFLASLFIQLFGLITPIFTQLILDRVIVQGSVTTLFAMGLGLWFYRTYYAKLLDKCQNNKLLFLKLSKFLKPKPQRFKTFKRLLIPSTTALVVFLSKYPTISPNQFLIVRTVLGKNG